jgi:flagellar biosynthesis/type III secretory pathway protein FliH
VRIPAVQVEVARRPNQVRVHPAEALGVAHHPSDGAVLRLRALQERDADRKRLQQQTSALLQRITGAIQGVEAQVAHNLDEVSSIAVELGLALAREVVGEAIDRGLVDPTPIVRRCLEQAVVAPRGQGPALRLQMHPEDLELWASQAEASEQQDVAVEVGPGLSRGEVVITTGVGQLHYDPREVCDRLCEAVRTEGFGEADGGDEEPGAPS